MNSYDYTVRLFKTMFPNYSDKINDFEYIGDMETIFYMSDGSRVIFDEVDKLAKYIEPNSDGKRELSEKEWQYEFSRKLKRKLELSNITLKELSEATGISYNSICRYARGDRTPDIFSIKKIANFLKCAVMELSDFNYLL